MIAKTPSSLPRCPHLSTDEIRPSLENAPLKMRPTISTTGASQNGTRFHPDNEGGDSEVVPFLALEEPKRKPRSVVWFDLEQAPKSSLTARQTTPQKQQQAITRVKKRRGMSPRTHGRAVAGNLASSPFDSSFLSSPNKFFPTFISPSRRSAAEATLFHATSRRGTSCTPRGKAHNSSVLDGGDNVVKGEDVHDAAFSVAVSSPTPHVSKKKIAPNSPARRHRAEAYVQSPDLSNFKIEKRPTATRRKNYSSESNRRKPSKTKDRSQPPCKPLLMFCKANRERVKLENPGIKEAKAINEILFAEFKNLSPEEIAKWCEPAASHDVTANKSTVTGGNDTVCMELRRRKSCPPQFFHKIVFDKNCSPSNRESPSKFDSPSSFGLMQSLEMEGHVSSSNSADGRSGVSKKRARISVPKKVDGESSAKDEIALGDVSTTNKSQESTKRLVENPPLASVKDARDSKNEGEEKKQSTSDEKKKRRRGRTQHSSLLTGLVLPDAISSQELGASQSPGCAKHLPVTAKNGSFDKVLPAPTKEAMKNPIVKSETLSNKELEEILVKRRRKSVERAKKAAAKKQAAQIAKSSAGSAKLDDYSITNTQHFGDATVTVTMLTLAKKPPVQDNLILRLLNEDADIFDKSACGDKISVALGEKAPSLDTRVVEHTVSDGPSELKEPAYAGETKTIMTESSHITEDLVQDKPLAVSDVASSLQGENSVSSSTSSKTSSDSPRRKKRHNASSLEKSSGISSSVSEDSNQIGRRGQAESNEAISNKQLRHHLLKTQADRGKKAAGNREKPKSNAMPSQQLGEAEAKTLALGPAESEQPLSEQRAWRDGVPTGNSDGNLTSPESPLRAKRLLSALYNGSPVPIEGGKESSPPLSTNLLIAMESETRHSNQSYNEERNGDSPTEYISPRASEMSGVEASPSEPVTDNPDESKCTEPSQNDRNSIAEDPAVSLRAVAIEDSSAVTEGIHKPLDPKPFTALKAIESERSFSEPLKRSEGDQFHSPRQTGEAYQNDAEMPATTPLFVTEDETLRSTRRLEPMDSAWSNSNNRNSPQSHGSTLPYGVPFPTQSVNSTNNTLCLVPTHAFLDLPSVKTIHEEKQLQILLAERQYQEKLAEFTRLELETKMMAERMLAIEERVRGIDSLSTFHRVDDFDRPDHYESVVSRTYRSEILSSRKRRRFHSPDYFDSSVDEYARSHDFSRRRSRNLDREEKQYCRTSPKRRARHTLPERSRQKERYRSAYIDDSRYSSDEEFEYSRRSSREGLKKEKTRPRRSEDFSDNSFEEFDQPRRGSRERSKEKENIRSRQSHDSNDRSRVEFEHSRHRNNRRQMVSSVSRNELDRVERPRSEKSGQSSESRGRSPVEFEQSRHGISSGKKEVSVSRKQLGRGVSPRRGTSGQSNESKGRSRVEPAPARHNKYSERKKLPVSRKQISRVESPRRAKSGQLSVLEDIGIQHNSLHRGFENDARTEELSSFQQGSPPTKALAPKKDSNAMSMMGDAEDDIDTSTEGRGDDTSKQPRNQNEITGNVVRETKPPTQSCWLTGEDTSDSDWDFEGPMILPPPPL